MAQRVDFKISGNQFEAAADGLQLGPYDFSDVREVWLVRYGDDFSGSSPDSFWVIKMISSALVLPDHVPAIRSQLLDKIRTTAEFKESSCRAPPKNWRHSGGLLRSRELKVTLLDPQAFDAATKDFSGTRVVTQFEEASL